MRWALLVSLGLNLVAAGVIGGALIKGPPPAPVTGPALWRYARALPDPYRHDLGQALRASRGDWAGAREALRGQQAALAAALTAEPFDPKAVEAVLTRQTQVTDDLAGRGVGLLLAQIGRMDPSGRAAYAEALRNDRGPGHRPDRDDDRARPGAETGAP
jgi:uncharacterized membrane protein